MEKALDGFDVSGDSLRDISSSLERSVGPAVIWSQIAARAGKVRSGHLLLAWLDEDLTRRWLQQRVPSGITSVALDVARGERTSRAGAASRAGSRFFLAP